MAALLSGWCKKNAKPVWGDDCEQAFLVLKKALVQPSVLAYPTRDGLFVLSMDASDLRMGAVLEQEQEEGKQVVKRVHLQNTQRESEALLYYQQGAAGVCDSRRAL